MRNRTIIYLFIIVICYACSSNEVQVIADPIDTTKTISGTVVGYLNEVLDIMEANSINKKTINWPDFRTKVFEKAGAAQTINEASIAIKEALILLNDNHSFFLQADGTLFSGFDFDCLVKNIPEPTLPENVGYVKVNWFSGQQAIGFAEVLQNQIRKTDHIDMLGWIVDLRGNTGGNMWPMLTGIGPLLGEGTAGYFVDPDNNQIPWGYADGASTIDGNPAVRLSSPYEMITHNPKIAVLLDNAVASSGEAIAISFIGREYTKSFGSATCGKSTANMGYDIRDGSKLFLTVSYMADRDMNLYGVPIVPDVEVPDENTLQSALEWIEN